MSKDFFKENNVQYTEINVAGDPKAREEMVNKTGQTGVPVIEIDGKIIIGYDVKSIEKALK